MTDLETSNPEKTALVQPQPQPEARNIAQPQLVKDEEPPDNVEDVIKQETAPVDLQEIENKEPDPPPTKPPYETLNKAQKASIMFAVAVSLFLAALDQNIVIVSLPKITTEFGHPELLSWVIAAYMVASCAVLALYGRFSDVYGRRAIFLVALALFITGSGISGGSTTIWMLIIARGVQGLGGGGLMALSFIIIGDIAAPRQRPKFLSAITSVFGVASVLGPVLGGVFTDSVGWRWVFWINLPLGGVALIIVFFAMVYSNVTKKLPLDVIGAILIACCSSCFVFFISWGGQAQGYPWNSGVIIGLIVASVVLGVLFVIQELRHPLPILNLRLFKDRNITLLNGIMSAAGVVIFGTFSFYPVYFQEVHGDSALISGLKGIPLVGGIMMTSVVAGVVLTKFGGHWRLNLVAGSIFLTLGAGLLTMLDVETSYVGIAFYFLLVGFGLGLLFPTATATIQNMVSPADMANALSSLRFCQNLGGAIGVAIMGSLLTSGTNRELAISGNHRKAVVAGIKLVFAVGCGFGGLTFIQTLFLKKTDENLKHRGTALKKGTAAAAGAQDNVKGTKKATTAATSNIHGSAASHDCLLDKTYNPRGSTATHNCTLPDVTAENTRNTTNGSGDTTHEHTVNDNGNTTRNNTNYSTDNEVDLEMQPVLLH